MTCFLAVAKPSLEQGVTAAATSQFERVVVVPHLLFDGQLLQRVRKIVAEQEKGGSRQQWLLAGRLGADPAVAGAVVRRFREAFASLRMPR